MAMTSSALPKLLQPRQVYQDIYFAYKSVPKLYNQIFQEEDTSLATVKDLNIITLGPFQNWEAEGDTMTIDRMYEGYEWEYTPTWKALQVPITHKAVKTYQVNILREVMRSLGRSAAYTIEQMAFGVFNLGTSVNGGDGVPLFSNSHPLYDGSTDSNIASADLTPDALFDAIVYFSTLTDDRGIPIYAEPKILLIPPALVKVAHEILKSPYAPYTGDNQVNYLYDQNIKIIVSRYLTDNNDWYLLADKGENGLKGYWLEKLTLDHYEDKETRGIVYQGWFAVDFGWSDWRMCYMGQAS